MFERRTAEIRIADATQALTSAEKEEAECAAVSLALDVVELLIKRGRCGEAVAAAERVIGEEECQCCLCCWFADCIGKIRAKRSGRRRLML
jgi:hypothetical protein